MIGCDKYQEIMSQMLDGEVEESLKTDLQAHLVTCPECRSVYEAFKAISLSLDTLEAPASLAPGVMEAVREIAASEAEPPIPLRLVKKKPKVFARLVAIAACLALIVFAASRSDFFDKKPTAGDDSQPAGFGVIGATSGEDVHKRTADPEDSDEGDDAQQNSSDMVDGLSPFACGMTDYGGYDVANISSVEIYYTAVGPAEQATRILTDKDDIEELLDMMRYSDDFVSNVPEGDGDYHISFVSDSPDHGISVWISDGILICRNDGMMDAYIAAGLADEFSEMVSE